MTPPGESGGGGQIWQEGEGVWRFPEVRFLFACQDAQHLHLPVQGYFPA